MAAFFDVSCNLVIDHRVRALATDLAWTLDRSGITLPAQDILIASCAVRSRVPVLTTDRHFNHIPNLEVIPFDE